MNEFQEWEKQLTAEPEISFAGKVEAFNPKAKPGERYTIRVRKDTVATGEFVSKPPSQTQWGQTNIVGYKWKDGLWLFETAAAAEERKKLSALSPNLQQAGALAKRLQTALLKAKRNNLVAQNSGVKRGQSGIFNLASPYQGNTSMKALNATNTNNGDAVLLLSNSGWVAFGNDTEGGKLTRRDIERGGGDSKKPIRGQLGYAVTTLVATIQTNTLNSLSWSRKWQLWVGGLTSNMILVKEWAFSMPSGIGGNPWEVAEEPFVTLDVRGNEWIVSMSRLWFQNDYWMGVYKGSIKDGTADGTVSPDVTVLWEKKYSDITLPTYPGTRFVAGWGAKQWRPYGFGYFSNFGIIWQVAGTGQQTLCGYDLKALDGQTNPTLREFTDPVNYPIPMGWGNQPDFYTNIGDLMAASLCRVGSDGRGILKGLDKVNIGSSVISSVVQEHLIYSEVDGSPPIIGGQSDYDPMEEVEWFHQIERSKISLSALFFMLGLSNYFFDVYRDFISVVDWVSNPLGLLYKSSRVTLINQAYSPTAIAAGSLSNTVPNWQMWDEVFPELRPASAPMRTTTVNSWWNTLANYAWATNEAETPASRAAADEEAMSNIFHSDKDITVFLRQPNLIGKKDENLTVTTLQAKQILDIVEGGTLRLERLKIHGASFAAEGYQ